MILHITVGLSTHFCFISLKAATKSFVEGVVEEVAAGSVVAAVEVVVVVIVVAVVVVVVVEEVIMTVQIDPDKEIL